MEEISAALSSEEKKIAELSNVVTGLETLISKSSHSLEDAPDTYQNIIQDPLRAAQKAILHSLYEVRENLADKLKADLGGAPAAAEEGTESDSDKELSEVDQLRIENQK